MTVTLSIIIPTLNEQNVLGATLARLADTKNCEVIVVDGGSSDATLALAVQAGCKTLSSPRGRGRQMNLGAEKATAETLLFLHADTLLPENFPELILDAVHRPAVAAGAFSLAIDSPAKSLAVIAYFTNLRSRLLHLPYGDQALFITRKMFSAIGGFPEMEIMEDFVFVKKAQKKGAIIILPECATTSARRWQNLGTVRTTLINQLIVCGHSLGVPPAILSRWYRRMRGVGN
ncbi:glycosyltransferase [Desulfopila sp. IMCC35006]|uniref:TIGR04283 family arsenosugar biosynthesis glycosyltransferase n=1 Tax=Desulfopila sp. IMCC35006 TaxID=2569542 RepID=UPI0010AB584F|nr:TIGR04283 family arsenosugar biosynthesis glycosyltransferase [Desulfopila sp. IMCC35006]TKB25503.1 glycosyltransferase [Desulfopila sp. IMCC35006]